MNFLRLLEQIGRAPVRGARAINDAMYDEDPILRERKERIDLGPGLGESDVPTGDMETVGFGPKRPSRLNNVLSEAARGAIVAARNPTRGHIGTAGDIFGAMGAVEDDTRARSDRQMALNRQAEKDAMDRRLNESRARENEAQADYAQWRTTQAKTGRSVAPDRLEVYTKAYDHAISQGAEPEAAKRWATEIALGQRDSYNANSRDPKQNLARAEDALARGEISPEEYQARVDRIQSALKASAQNTEEGKRIGKGVPFIRGKNVVTDKGAKNYFPPTMDPNTGKTYGGTMGDEVLYQPPVKKPAQRQPPRDRIETKIGEDGKAYNVNKDTNKAVPVEGYTPKVTGAKKKGLNLAGDAAAINQKTTADPKIQQFQQYRKSMGLPPMSDEEAAKILKTAQDMRSSKAAGK